MSNTLQNGAEPITIPTLRGYIRAESISPPRDLMVRSSGAIVASALLPYFFIAIAAAIGHFKIGGWLLTILAAFFPMLAAQRLFQTLVHDLSHLLFSKNRIVNDLLGNLFAAGFIGMRVQNYRKVHLGHHAANGSADDPEFVDFRIVEEAGGLAWFVIKFAMGREVVSLIKKYYFSSHERHSSGQTGSENNLDLGKLVTDTWHIQICQIPLFYAFGGFSGTWYLYLLWLYLAVTWSPMLSRLRFLVEHPGVNDLTVSTRAPFIERLFFAPYNFNFHFEHHLWPSLPPYNLKRAHEVLSDDGYFQRHPEYVQQSFLRALARRSIA